MADALSELSGHGAVDPDAQAAVTDFHDYTEFFPSDLARSLTLIGQLDAEFAHDSARVHALTKTYGALPSLPPAERPDAHALRKDVSQHLAHALRARAATVAEATRLCDVADTLYSRLVGIRKKQAAVPPPLPSKEASPRAAKVRSPQASRTRKVDVVERARPSGHAPVSVGNTAATAAAKEKKRSRRIIVPGEVLPPFDPNSPLASDFSSSEDDLPPPSPIRPPTNLLRGGGDGLSSSASKALKMPKTPRPPKAPKVRPPGVMGTNVHSTVAGISVSNAMAQLTPPPPDAQRGSEWAPWLTLTEWELNLLRRRMKKNANWKPSDTMMRRELRERNRGPEAYAEAKADAEARGEALLDELPHRFSARERELQTLDPAAHGSDDELSSSVGIKLHDPKKQKRRAEETPGVVNSREIKGEDNYMAQITAAGQSVAAIYQSSVLGFNGSPLAARRAEGGQKDGKGAKKRKRDGPNGSSVDDDASVEAGSSNGNPKKIKLVARPLSVDENGDPSSKTITTQVPLAPEGPATPEAQRSHDGTRATAASARPSRTVRAPTPGPKSEEKTPSDSNAGYLHAQSASPRTTPTNGLSARPKTSRGTTNITLRLTQKAASAEPPHHRSTRRRASETALLQPDVDAKSTTSTAASSRGKRSAPGLTVGGEEGGAKLSLTRRKNDPAAQKKGGSAAEPLEKIDPNEPTYCLCDNVSWGTMVACENPSCPLEWFHLQCVGLEQPPGKRQRWWCPDCRKKLGIGQFGEKKKA